MISWLAISSSAYLRGSADDCDLLVHHRLRDRRLVGLVVAMPAVTHQVDDHVLAETVAVVQRQPATKITASGSSPLTWKIGAWTTSPHRCRVVERLSRVLLVVKTDLVVDHDMHGAADRVTTGLRHVEHLHVHALAGERGVAVQDDRQHLFAAAVAAALLARAHRTLTTGPMISRCEG